MPRGRKKSEVLVVFETTVPAFEVLIPDTGIKIIALDQDVLANFISAHVKGYRIDEGADEEIDESPDVAKLEDK